MHLVQLQIHKLSTTTNCVCVCVLKKVLTLNCALESSNLSILFECVRAFHQITTKLMFKKTISMELCESTLPMEYFTNLPFVICYLTWGQTQAQNAHHATAVAVAIITFIVTSAILFYIFTLSYRTHFIFSEKGFYYLLIEIALDPLNLLSNSPRTVVC